MAELTPKQITAVAALLGGKSIEQAAQEAEVGATTVHRWFRESDAFNAALAEGRRAALHTAVTTLSYTARSAAAVVLEIMQNKKTPPGIRLRAALGVLELLSSWAANEDIDERLRRLERLSAGQEGTDDDNLPGTTPAA
jgi:AcrR family transcriptional regulator